MSWTELCPPAQCSSSPMSFHNCGDADLGPGVLLLRERRVRATLGFVAEGTGKDEAKNGGGSWGERRGGTTGLGPSSSRRTHFLLVLMWPTWPQLAHLRCVPAPRPLPTPPSAGESPAEALVAPFCFSRAKRRSLLRFKRLSSASMLGGG